MGYSTGEKHDVQRQFTASQNTAVDLSISRSKPRDKKKKILHRQHIPLRGSLGAHLFCGALSRLELQLAKLAHNPLQPDSQLT